VKVVLFCGGLGTRLREFSETIPKPLVNVGYRPMIWHLMRYYAHFGHKDFVLCLGYRGDMVREFFLKYEETMTNDFTFSNGGRTIETHGDDIQDWRITFVDTGLHSNIGQRLVRVKKYIGGEDLFLANYSDGLSDLPLDNVVNDFTKRDAVAGFASVRSPQSFHAVMADDNGVVTGLEPINQGALWLNGGYFVFRRQIFDYIEDGEELVEEPFQRLCAKRALVTYRHEGFWQSMDTFKDKITFDRMEARGRCPWMVWRNEPDMPKAR
jgi:glucose-1-phosphate cytidylyltransferase